MESRAAAGPALAEYSIRVGGITQHSMRFSIRPPADNSRGPTYVASLLTLLHRADVRREGIDLILRTDHGQVGLAVDCPDSLSSLFREVLLDAYPGTEIVPTDPTGPQEGTRVFSAPLFWTPDILPLRATDSRDAVGGQYADPLSALFAALRSGRSGRVEASVALRMAPASSQRIRTAERIGRTVAALQSAWLRERYLACSCGPSRRQRLFAAIVGGFVGCAEEHSMPRLHGPLFEAFLTIEVFVPTNAAEVAQRKLHEIEAALQQFRTREARFIMMAKPPRRGFLLGAPEAAALWHPLVEPAGVVSRVEQSHFREVEPPVSLPSANEGSGVTVLGQTLYRRQRNRFGIRNDDLRRHLIAIGKTGCGKSTFLSNIVRQQIEMGQGVVLLDPHGQLVEEVLDYIPKRRTNEVILFDAGDRSHVIGFNPLIGPPGSDPTLIADGVLTAFKNVFGFDEGSAPRLLHIFRNCLLSLIGRPDASLLTVQRLLVDANYRNSVVAQVMNSAVREFWLSEFGRWNERDRTQYIASLQNKLGAFTTNQRLQAIFAPSPKGIQLRSILDHSQILLCNLSKGTVGHDASTLLGSLLLSSLHVAALSRADTPEADRRDATVVVDEIHSFLAEGNNTMADALAESRKYRTNYLLATQMLEQLDKATLAGVLGNCGSVLCMTAGPRDAEVLAPLFGAGLLPHDLTEIPKYHGYMRLLVDGAPRTFSMTTLPPPRGARQRAEIVRTASRERYGKRGQPTGKATIISPAASGHGRMSS